MTSDPYDNSLLPGARLKNRLFCIIYEAMLVFGVLFMATWLFSTLLEQKNALYLRGALQDWLFVVLGLYFCWFWTHGGQTLAMKTWAIKLVDKQGLPVTWKRALARYALCWLSILPGMAVAHFSGARGWMMLLMPALNFILWAAATRWDADHQFPHDRLAGTRLVTLPGMTNDTSQSLDDE